MKHHHSILLTIAALALFQTHVSQAAAPAAPAAAPGAPGAPATSAAKPKPFSSNDAGKYVSTAESIQFQLNMGARLRSRFKDTDPDLVTFGGKLSKEATELYTPGVSLAQDHGVDGKRIPQDMAKADKDSVGKLNAIKDDKKWTLAFFDLFARDSKKNALEADRSAKSVMDPDLKAFLEKASAMLKSQSDAIETKSKELKARK